MADWFRNRVLVTKNDDSDKGFKEFSDLLNAYDENSEESEKFLSFVDCPITRFILLSEDIEVYNNEIQFGIISAYRPVFELKEICNKYKCDVHVVYAHEREELNDWDGEPSIGCFSACLKNNEVVYEQKSPDAADSKKVHEFFSMAWDGNISPDPIDRDTFFDQHDIGFGFYIKDYEDDDVGISPSFKQWLGLEKIDAPFGLVGYEDEYDPEDEDCEEEEGVSYVVHDSLEDFLQSINDDDDEEEYDNEDEYDDDDEYDTEDDYDNSDIDYDDEEFEIWNGILSTYSGTASEVIIPDGVKVIGGEAFMDCTTIKSVVIPDGVKKLANYAFQCCTNLSKITIPETVTCIEDHTFEGCTSLETVIIPEGITEIGSNAFAGCKSLTTVNIPDSVTKIERCLFQGCTNLSKITIPETVTCIEDHTFEGCTSLETVIIPEGITEISSKAFAGCTSLSKITIPETVKHIENYAFNGCTSLETINIPEGITEIGSNAFAGCKSLTTIKIPDSVTKIENCLFQGCTSLTNISIPDSVETIGDSAFAGCTSLTTVNIPDSVTEIGDNVFLHCSIKNLNNPLCSIVNGLHIYEEKLLYCSDSSITSVVIPDGVRLIGYSCFEGCKNLTSIKIPNSVTEICDRAFQRCSNLKSVLIPDSVEIIGDSAFAGCTSLTTVNIPDSVTEIGDNVFSLCSIKNLNNPLCSIVNGLHIYEEKLLYCSDSSITNVVIPDGVTKICKGVFQRCTNLKSVLIPGSVETIDDYAFNECTSLKEIIIPDSVNYLGEGIFSGCTSLKKITIPNSVTEIGWRAFEGCTSLFNVTLPEGIKDIFNGTFSNCKSLKSIQIPDSVTFIDQSAFLNCPLDKETLNLIEALSDCEEDEDEDCEYVSNVEDSSYEEFPQSLNDDNNDYDNEEYDSEDDDNDNSDIDYDNEEFEKMEINVEKLANAILTLKKNAEITITGGNWNLQNHNEVKRALASRENENMNFIIRFSEELTRWKFKEGTFISPCVKAIYFPVSLIETDFNKWTDLIFCEYFQDGIYSTEYYFPEFWKEIPEFSKIQTKRIKFYTTDKKQFGPGKYEFWFSSHCNYLEVTATTQKQAIESLKNYPDCTPFNSFLIENDNVNQAFTFSGFDASEDEPIEFSIGKYIENDCSYEHAEDYFKGIIRDPSSKVMSLEKDDNDDGFYLPLGTPIVNREINFKDIKLEQPYYVFIDPQKHHVESFILDAKEGFNLSDIHFNKVFKLFFSMFEFSFSLINSVYYKDKPLIQNECKGIGNDCLQFYKYVANRLHKLDAYSDKEVNKLKNIIKADKISGEENV